MFHPDSIAQGVEEKQSFQNETKYFLFWTDGKTYTNHISIAD
jgi:hypothetical protein